MMRGFRRYSTGNAGAPAAAPSGLESGDEPIRDDFGRADKVAIPRPRSDHFDGMRFFNPGVDTDKSFRDIWTWRRTRQPIPWPKQLDDVKHPLPPMEAVSGETLLTYVGQATVLIQVQGCNILTDPIFSQRASPLSFAGPKRVRSPGIALGALPPIHLVLLSHNHYDHLDLASLRRLHDRWGPTIVTGLGNGRFLQKRGIPGAIELDWWDRCSPRAGVDVSFVPAQHWSSRTLFDRRRTLWGGHVVQTAAGTLYFAGDSGYGPHFRDIAQRFRPDVALLPIGAYEPRGFMQAQHMNPDDAARAHRDLGVSLSIGIHWGTFQLTDEAIDAPILALEQAKRVYDISPEAFLAPQPGETMRWRREAC